MKNISNSEARLIDGGNWCECTAESDLFKCALEPDLFNKRGLITVSKTVDSERECMVFAVYGIKCNYWDMNIAGESVPEVRPSTTVKRLYW